MQADVILEYVT